jgi:hypothetical protein
MASATLTLLSPQRYGVIDIRVWQLLHAHGVVTRNAVGVGLSAGNWRQFLGVIRHFARKLRVKARDVGARIVRRAPGQSERPALQGGEERPVTPALALVLLVGQPASLEVVVPGPAGTLAGTLTLPADAARPSPPS